MSVLIVSANRHSMILGMLAARNVDGSGTTQLCDLAADLSGTSGCGIMLLSDEASRGSLCTTDGVSAYIEDLQYTLGEGPSLDAHNTGSAVIESDLGSSSQTRWQALTPSMLKAGVKAIFAFPVGIGAVRLGALTLYRDQAGDLGDQQFNDTLIMAGVTARSILSMQANAALGGLAAELEDGSNFHFVVQQAAGMVSVQLGVGVTEAMIRLRSYAFRTERAIDDVARDIVERRLRLGNVQGPANPAFLDGNGSSDAIGSPDGNGS